MTLIANPKIEKIMDGWEKYLILDDKTAGETMSDDAPEEMKLQYRRFKEWLDKADLRDLYSAEELERELSDIFGLSNGNKLDEE